MQRRVKAILSYDGSHFHGFQYQKDTKHQHTIMASLESALKTLHILSPIVGAGRTDANVHALAQVIHFDIPLFWDDLQKLSHCLNNLLHPWIHIKSLMYVDETFHARFDAKKRLYRYVMYEGNYQPHLANYALHIAPLDVVALHRCTHYFVGTHRFGFFKKTGGATTGESRTIFKAGAYRLKHFIVIYFLGDAFLRSQVRMMTSILLNVCHGSFTESELIEQRDMNVKHSSLLAPACGLYLSKIYY